MQLIVSSITVSIFIYNLDKNHDQFFMPIISQVNLGVSPLSNIINIKLMIKPLSLSIAVTYNHYLYLSMSTSCLLKKCQFQASPLSFASELQNRPTSKRGQCWSPQRWCHRTMGTGFVGHRPPHGEAFKIRLKCDHLPRPRTYVISWNIQRID